MDIDDILFTPVASNRLYFNDLLNLTPQDEAILWRRIKDMEYSEFLESAYWYCVSAEARDRAAGRCLMCNSTQMLEVHHRTYASHGAEHRNMHDLNTFCRRCHGTFHKQKKERETQNVVVKTFHIPSQKKFNKLEKGSRLWRTYPSAPSSQLMPLGDPILLTKDLLRRCFNRRFILTDTTRLALFDSVYLPRKWMRSNNGRAISRARYWAALEGRFRS